MTHIIYCMLSAACLHCFVPVGTATTLYAMCFVPVGSVALCCMLCTATCACEHHHHHILILGSVCFIL